MYNVTSGFLAAVKQPSRVIRAKVVINGATTLTEDTIMSFSIERGFGGSLPVLGSVSAAKLSLGLINENLPAVLVGVPIVPSVAIETSEGVYEWIQLGVFYAAAGDITRTARSLTMECFDRMPDYDGITYGSSLTYPATLEAVKNEIAASYGISFAAQTLPAVTFTAAPQGTLRQVLSELALNVSGNAILNATGLVEFVSLSDTGFTLGAENYIDFRMLSEAPVKISQLNVKHGDTVLHAGDGSGYAVSIDSTNLTDQASADIVFSRVYPLTFTAYSLKAQGMPHMDLGDRFVFTDGDNVVRTLLVANHRLTYSGGLVSEFVVEAPKATVTETTPTGGSTFARAVTQARMELMVAVNEATRLITGAEGGHVFTKMDEVTGKPEELLILDTEDINTAMRVWRWNIEGLGYSSNGYMGPYKLAIRSDGTINADFITVGKLSADVIQVNSITNGMLSIDLQGIINSKISQTVYDTAMGEFDKELKASTDKTQALQDDLDGLVVGGPNQIRNSRGNYGYRNWMADDLAITGYSDAISVRYNGPGNVLRFATVEDEVPAYQLGIILLPDTIYTLSGRYYVGEGCKGISIQINGQLEATSEYDANYVINEDFVRVALVDNEYSNGAYRSFSHTFTTDPLEARSFLKIIHGGAVSDMSSIYVLFSLIEGSRPGVWAPNPLDLTDYTEDCIADSATTLTSAFLQTTEKFMTTVSTDYFTKTDAGVLQSSMDTKFTQTSSDFLMTFNTMTEVQNADRDGNGGKFTEISKFIKFDDGNIILGEAGNELILRIENDRIAFIQGTAEVAYFTNRMLYVTDGHFLSALRVGNFGYVPRENGNLSFRRM